MTKTKELFGSSAFLCKTCCKVVTKVKQGMKELENKVKSLEKENEDMRKELEAVKAKVGMCEGAVKIVQTGLETAKVEVREEMRSELKEKEERADNIVIYGLRESDKVDGKERMKDDGDKVREMCAEIEAEMEDEEIEVKFRAGKKREDGKARPLIVKIRDVENREKILANARKLARKDEWKRVFLAPDLTARQREEEKKKEDERKKEAEEKTRKVVAEGKMGKFIVVGQRDRRRIVWKEEEQEL